MIDQKSEYRFVSQGSLKYISVASKPYAARSQKRVTLGVDGAFLREALQERWDMLSPDSERGKIATPRKVDRAIDKTVYESVAIGVLGDFDGVRRLVQDGRFYDGKRIADLPIASDKLEYAKDWHYKNEYLTDEDWQEQERYNQMLRDLAERYTTLRSNLYTNYLKQKEQLPKDREKRDDQARDRYLEKYRDLNETYEKDREKAGQSYKAERQNIEKANEARLDRLYDALAKETDLGKIYDLRIQLEQAQVQGKMDLSECDVRYDQTTFDLRDTYQRNLAKAQADYTNELLASQDLYETQNAELDADYRKKNLSYAEAHGDGILDVLKQDGGTFDFDYGVKKGIVFPYYRTYQKAEDKARVTRSCAAKFYERTTGFKMAETPLNRLFADLEHATAFRIGTLHWRPAAYEYYGDNLIGEHDPFGPWYFTVDSAMRFFDETRPTRIGIYYGDRQTAHVVTKIYADIMVYLGVIYRVTTKTEIAPYDAVWQKNRKYAKDTVLYYKGPIHCKSWVRDVYSSWEGYIEWEGECEIRFRLDDDYEWTGDTPGYYVQNPCPYIPSEKYGYNIGPCTDLRLEDVYTTERLFRSYSMQRVELKRTRSGSAMTTEIDQCWDRYQEDCADINKTYNEKLKPVEDAYDAAKRDIEAAYENATRLADEEYEDSEEAARLQRVQATCDVSADINHKIQEAETDTEKRKLLDDWWNKTVWPAEDAYYQAVRRAEETREMEYRLAQEERHDNLAAAAEKYSTAKSEINKERNKKLAERYAVRDFDPEGRYVVVSGYLKEKQDIIDKYQDGPLKEIRERYKEEAKAASEMRNSRDRNHYSTFEQTVAGLGLPLEYESLPLSDEQIAWLGGYDVAHGTTYLTSYYAAAGAWREGLRQSEDEYNEDIRKARKKEWEAMLAISAEKQNARDLWEGDYTVPSDTSTPPSGEGEASKRVYCYVQTLRVWAVSEPDTLTNVDFSTYYEELDKEVLAEG